MYYVTRTIYNQFKWMPHFFSIGVERPLHNIYIGDFECSTLIDALILAHLPEPYTFRSVSSEHTYKIVPAGNKGLGMFVANIGSWRYGRRYGLFLFTKAVHRLLMRVTL
jgi:hypothetical protein